MKSLFKAFFKQLVIYTVVIMAVGFALSYFLPAGIITPTMPFLVIFFLIMTSLVHWYLLRSLDSKPGKFINTFLATTTIKLLLYMTIILVYVFVNKHDAISFAITFFLLYILYTVFEIMSVLPVAKKQQ